MVTGQATSGEPRPWSRTVGSGDPRERELIERCASLR